MMKKLKLRLSKSQKLKSFRFWLYDDSPDWFPETIDKLLLKILCTITGHDIISDNCGKPEHDYCWQCNKAYPYKADR